MEKYLKLPLTEQEVRELNVGDIVYLSGELVQLLAPAHKRALQMKKEGTPLPFEVENMAIYHCYTCLSENEKGLTSEFLGASTSAGVNLYEPEFIREFKVRAVIGKGGMNSETLKAMQEVGCVYLAQIGGCSQLCVRALDEIKEKFWNDLAANRGLKFAFKELGPLVVGMDAKGNSLFENVAVKAKERKKFIFDLIDK